jgi:hypothetical protein
MVMWRVLLAGGAAARAVTPHGTPPPHPPWDPTPWQVARQHAPSYFNLSVHVSCAWLRCYVERHQAATPNDPTAWCFYNEHAQLDWLVWSGLRVRALGAPSMGPALWERAVSGVALHMTAPGVAASERDKAMRSERSVLSDEGKWHKPAYSVRLNVSEACRAMLEARAARLSAA